MERSLIVGVDGSEPSLQALEWAVGEAVRRGVALRVVHASSWEWYEGHEPSFAVNRGTVRANAERVAAAAAERARSRPGAPEVTSEVPAEDPAAALIRLSREACAVVVGSRGRGELAGLLLGSVSLSVAAHAEAPVIVVRGEEAPRGGEFGRTTVGVGSAEQAGPALAYAFAAAERQGGELHAVRAWRCPAHEIPDYPRVPDVPDADDVPAAAGALADEHQRRAEADLDAALRDHVGAHPGVRVHREVFEGRPRAALLRASAGSGLLVVGARRRKGHVGMQLGPVNHALLYHSDCPVAVVPHK